MSDQQPPAFPRVTDSPADEQTVVSGEIFSRPGGEQPKPAPAETPPPQTPASMLMARDSRARWAVVGVATLVVVALIGAFVIFAGPKGGTPSTVARYAPADTVAYFEARLDLPGDQHDNLAAFMSHFPGFADQAAFDQKVDETFNQLLQGSESGLSWQADVEPWFGGQVGVFSSSLNPEPGTPPSVSAAFSVKDTSSLEAFLAAHLLPGAQSEDYQGQQIRTGSLLAQDERVSLAATDDALVLGTRIEDVKRALDARADREPGLADDTFFLQQLGALHADHLGLVYYDGREAAQQLRDQLDQLGELGQAVPNPVLDWALDAAASRGLAEIRAESDHLSVTSLGERPANADLPPLPANRSTTLAEAFPTDSLVYAETRDVGQTITFILDSFLTPTPGASPAPFDLNSIGDLLGTPIADYFDFIVDVGASVSVNGDEATIGLVATVDDNAVAESRVDRLLTIARTLMQFGGGITFTEQQHGDAQITVIALAGPTGDLGVGSVSITVANGRLYIGTGDFVVDALDRTRDTSLAARPEFQSGLQAGGASNAGIVFVDIAALRGLVEDTIPTAVRSEYDLNTGPFLAPLSHLMMVNRTEGTTSVGHVFLYVE